MNDLLGKIPPKEWELEWVGMPEFVQEKQEPYAKINIRFENEQELQEFALLLGQHLTRKTKAVWFKQLVRGKNAKKRWVDES